MFKILNFKTEYQKSPLGIDRRKPRFSWQYSEDDGGNARVYRICVASREDGLENPDLWDSGDVNSSESIGIEYNGEPLRSHTRYYVRLCVGDSSGKTAEHRDFFETALFDIEDWKG